MPELVAAIKAIEGTETGATVAVFLALISAVAHATFGAIVKAGDPVINRGAINICYGVMAAPFALYLFPWPSQELWPVLALMFLVHVGYEWFQVKSFELGSFVLVYPIGRGSSPLLIALGGVLVFAEQLKLLQWLGILLISVGIFGIAFANLAEAKKQGKSVSDLQSAILFALLSGIFVALYTIVDAYGIRLAENPFTFIAWFFFTGLFGSPVLAYLRYCKQPRQIDFPAMFRRGMIGAVIGIVSFGCIMMATRLGQVATVAALRETSIIFGTLWGIFFFREVITPARLGMIGLIVVGAILVEL